MAIAQVPARTALLMRLSYLHSTASAFDPKDPLNRGYQGARSTLRRKLPVVAGCRCLFFGSRVAACGIHATADEENRPMQS